MNHWLPKIKQITEKHTDIKYIVLKLLKPWIFLNLFLHSHNMTGTES